MAEYPSHHPKDLKYPTSGLRREKSDTSMGSWQSQHGGLKGRNYISLLDFPPVMAFCLFALFYWSSALPNNSWSIKSGACPPATDVTVVLQDFLSKTPSQGSFTQAVAHHTFIRDWFLRGRTEILALTQATGEILELLLLVDHLKPPCSYLFQAWFWGPLSISHIPSCLSYGSPFFRKLARICSSHLQVKHLLTFCCLQEAVYHKVIFWCHPAGDSQAGPCPTLVNCNRTHS